MSTCSVQVSIFAVVSGCVLLSMSCSFLLHKNPHKERYIAGSAKCTTKPLLKLLSSILTAVEVGLQSYHDTCYSRSGITSNSMWILKNSKDLLKTLNSRLLSEYKSNKTYAFNTLYFYSPYSAKIPSQKHICIVAQKITVRLDNNMQFLVEILHTL